MQEAASKSMTPAKVSSLEDQIDRTSAGTGSDDRVSPVRIVLEAGRADSQYWRDLWRVLEMRVSGGD